MMKKRFFVLSISALLFMGVIFSANAYHELIKTWEGVAHEHCGHTASTPSAIGTLTLSINETGDLEPYQAFVLTIVVNNFTEAIGDPYYGRVMIGVPGVAADAVVMDNHLFSLPLGSPRFNRRRSVDSYGSYNTSGSSNKFTLLAPGVAGSFDLMGLAIAGVNQSGDFAAPINDAEMNITYIEETISITVVAPSVPGPAPSDPQPSIPGFLTIILVSSITVTVFAVVLKVRRKKRIIE